MADDETWMRTRMTEVLRSDPRRDIGDDRSMRELCDFVCGDVISFRERIVRLEAEIEKLIKQRDTVQRHYDEHLRECMKTGR